MGDDDPAKASLPVTSDLMQRYATLNDIPNVPQLAEMTDLPAEVKMQSNCI